MRHRLSLSRALDAVSPAAQAVTALMVGWDPDARDAVDLALVEALTNIVRHGPKGETRPIRMEVELADDHVAVDIIDVTPPAPPDALARAADCRLDVDTDAIDAIPESGRGLALMLVLMDEVSLHLDGPLPRLRLMRRR